MPILSPPVSLEIVATHEALLPRLLALFRQVDRQATRQPDGPVAPATMRLARGLLREARRVLRRSGRGLGLGVDELRMAGLAVLLAQAVAGLEAFEAAHTLYAVRYRAVCWQLAGGRLQPVSRLKPHDHPKGLPVPTPAEAAQTATMRARLEKRLIRRENFSYVQGYRDGQSGRPPRTPLTEFPSVP